MPISTNAPTRRIAEIVIGERIREDMGELEQMAESIRQNGMLQPVGISPDGKLNYGERRLRAAQLAGLERVPVVIREVTEEERVRFEIEENRARKDFTPSEAEKAKRKYEVAVKAMAAARMKAGIPYANLAQGPKGTAREQVATLTGYGHTSLAKAEAVVDAAEAEPETFGKLLVDMDRTGRVHGPYKRLRMLQQAALIRAEPPPLPGNGPYRVAVVDLPWLYELRDEDPSHRAIRPYPTMSIAEMCKLAVGSIIHADAVLWLWIPNFELVHGAHLPILEAWGFEPKSLITWGKDRMGHGDWLRAKTEHVIMCVRGKPIVTLTNQTTLLLAPMRGHSVKPREFYDLVESLCPAPRYADLFSRHRHNDKWDCHGDEAPVAPTPPPPPIAPAAADVVIGKPQRRRRATAGSVQ